MDRFFEKKITFFCEKAILESLSGMALSSLERQAFLPSQARRVDIATGHGICQEGISQSEGLLQDASLQTPFMHALYGSPTGC